MDGRRRLFRTGAFLVSAAFGLTAPAAASPTRHAAVGGAGGRREVGCVESPFTPGFEWVLAHTWPGHRISAAVYDTRTGCQYLLRPDLQMTTASVLKAEILGGVLLRAERQQRGLTAWEQSLVYPMIRYSDDPSANALWSSLGGVAGMQSVDAAFGLGQTQQANPWGDTATTAFDRNIFMRKLLLDEGSPLSAPYRSLARAYLLQVTPSQRWGITAGVPAGWSVPLKNGFFPAVCCAWRVNTSGMVERPGGGGYVLTVMSDGWPSLAAGIPAVEFVARDVASWMLVRVGPFLSAARFADQAYLDVEGYQPTFQQEQGLSAAVGTNAGQAGIELAAMLDAPEIDQTSGTMLRLYLGALHQRPWPFTWAVLLAHLRSHSLTMDQFADVVAASPDFTGGTALSTGAFVDLAYMRVLGHVADGNGRRYWMSRIDGGGSRGALLLDLTNRNWVRFSYGRTIQVTIAYLTIMRRLPSPGEVGWWGRYLSAGHPTSDLTGALFTSSAYAARF